MKYSSRGPLGYNTAQWHGRIPTISLHGVTIQQTMTWIFTAVETSDLKYEICPRFDSISVTSTDEYLRSHADFNSSREAKVFTVYW